MQQSDYDAAPTKTAAPQDPFEPEAQQAVIRHVATSNDIANDHFEEDALAYARWRHPFFERVCAGAIDELRFDVEAPETLTSLIEREGGAIVVLSHTGCWFAVPFAMHRLGIPFTFLMETASKELLERYAAIGIQPIQPLPGATFHLADGRRIRVPASSTLQQIQEAAEKGLAVGLFGDTYRPRGQQVQLLGHTVHLINHYALLAERLDRMLVVLRQWTESGTVHIRFETIAPPLSLTKRFDRVRYRVQAFAGFLDEDLHARPEQYAYFPNSVFGHAAARPATDTAS